MGSFQQSLPAFTALALSTLLTVACGASGVNPPTQTVESTTLETAAALPQSPVSEPTNPAVEPVAAADLLCGSSTAEHQATFLKFLNEARAEARQCGNTTHDPAPALTWNEQLHSAAVQHSNDMANNNFFNHTGTNNGSVTDRVDATGYVWRTVGENIAAGQLNAEETMEGWLTSPGHCRNIMNPAFKEVGATCVENESADYKRYWTKVLGAQF